MKVVHLNYSDSIGGAARAALRIHQAVRGVGVDSKLLVNRAVLSDPTVIDPATAPGRLLGKARRILATPWQSLPKGGSPGLHSPACIPSRWASRLNASAADVVHLHWINCEMMSIADIGRLTKPVVWTLHDMWAFCGAEHYTDGFRWREGYSATNRPAQESGFDLDRWTWRRKQRHWRRPLQIVTPSRWLAGCVEQSALMGDWPVTVIPNPVDTEVWRPVDKLIARQKLNLPQTAPILLFGALGGDEDPRKGYDLLRDALQHLRGRINGMELNGLELNGLELVVFGQLAPTQQTPLGFPVRHTGYLHDDEKLRLLYNAADAVAVPSRLEAFGQTASEAHACGTPVVAFNTGGLADIVAHRQTGYLAAPFDVQDLAAGIEWVLGAKASGPDLGIAARERACRLWDTSVVARQYAELYAREMTVR
ncbi:MAG: glycosyltransferase family 4 protein [Planctomycetia bacterium]|nr:glycosyltransferase family 4 protein [Planctomycetia bacterium]